MIICLCNNVSQTDIIEELKNNKTILEALGDCGVGMGCGICLSTVKELFGIDRSDLFSYNLDKSGL